MDDDFSPEPEGMFSEEIEDEYVLDTDEDWKRSDLWSVKTLPESYYGERVRRVHKKH